MNAHGHRRRERAEHPRYSGLAILADAPDHAADIGNLNAVALPRNRPDDIRIRHEIVDISLMHERVPKGNDLFSVDRRNRPRRTDAEITVDNGNADRLTTLKRRIVARMYLTAVSRRTERNERRAGGQVLFQITQPRRIESTRKEIRLLLRLALFRCLALCRRVLFRRFVCFFRGLLCTFCIVRLLTGERIDHIAPLCLTLRT